MTSTQHRLDERTLQQVVCERIEDRVAALREPSTTHVTAWVLSEDRLRLEPRPHVVEHPSLLEQLELAVSGTSGPASGAPGYESKPAIRVEALDTLASIEREAASFVRSILHHLVPGGVDQHLAFLVARAPTLRADDRRTLDEFVLRWWARARVTTTWDSPAARPFVPCPACDRRGTIRVRRGLGRDDDRRPRQPLPDHDGRTHHPGGLRPPVGHLVSRGPAVPPPRRRTMSTSFDPLGNAAQPFIGKELVTEAG